MKYVVSGGATLSLTDGTRFELSPGIHDSSSFPDGVKQHWAFEAYAKPLDAAELAKEQEAENLASSLVLMAEENNNLKALVAEHEKTIADQEAQIATLKEQQSAAGDAANKADNAAEGVKSVKKQQASN